MLEKIHTAHDVKKLNIDEMNALAGEIRDFLIENVAKTGGHLSANLGVVELTIALFAEFDPYYDRIVWDVGHQSYVHKILTGRAERFNTLRKYGGMSGFPKVSESKADAFNSGHSSTSISAAAGFAAAARLKKTGERAIAVIGDGAMTGGMAFEAINHAGSIKLPVIVVLNDNGMSISKNVSALSKSLKRLRSTVRYFRIKSNVKSVLDSVPYIGKPLKKRISEAKKIIRNLLIPSSIFEDFGFKYMGPVDGHDIEKLRIVFAQAKKMNEPVLIHINTKKGKGYSYAEKNPDFFHGVSSFDEITGKPITPKKEDWSSHFGKELCGLAEKNHKITAVTAAMKSGTGLTEFAQKFADRFYDVAIAEQHAVTFSAGMARSGFIPVVAIYSTFMQRAYDQIIHDVALMNLHVVFCIDRCGPVGEDGETHQGMFDISYMLQIPNMTVFSPSCVSDFDLMLDYAVNKAEGPIAIRYPRGEIRNRRSERRDVFEAELVADGTDVTIVAVGICVYDAQDAVKILEESGISVAVIDMGCLNPKNTDFIKLHCADKKTVASIEDGVKIGGFGQYIEDVLGRSVMKFAYPNEPIVQGSTEQIKDKYAMSAESIAEAIKGDFYD